MADRKACSKCGVEKTLESFYRYHKRKDGRLGVCKRCFLAAQKARAERNQGRWTWARG